MGSKKGVPHVWDSAIDYKETQIEILRRIEDARSRCGTVLGQDAYGKDVFDPTPFKELAVYSTALIQVENGCRASEGVDAMTSFIMTGNRVPSVRVRKKSARCMCGHSRSWKIGAPQNVKETTGHVSIRKGFLGRGRCQVKDCICKSYVPNQSDVDVRDLFLPPNILDSDKETLSKLKLGEGGFNAGSYKSYMLVHFHNSHSLRFLYVTDMTSRGYTVADIMGITHHSSPEQVLGYLQKKRSHDIQKARALGQPLPK